MALFVLAVNKGLCATFRTIFEKLAQQADVNTAVQEAIDRYRAQQNGRK